MDKFEAEYCAKSWRRLENRLESLIRFAQHAIDDIVEYKDSGDDSTAESLFDNLRELRRVESGIEFPIEWNDGRVDVLSLPERGES